MLQVKSTEESLIQLKSLCRITRLMKWECRMVRDLAASHDFAPFVPSGVELTLICVRPVRRERGQCARSDRAPSTSCFCPIPCHLSLRQGSFPTSSAQFMERGATNQRSRTRFGLGWAMGKRATRFPSRSELTRVGRPLSPFCPTWRRRVCGARNPFMPSFGRIS